MMAVILLLLILLAWVFEFLSAMARAGVEKAKKARRGITKEPRKGFSPIPVIPIALLAVWGIALLVDLVVDPWGTVIVAAIHAAWLVLSLLSIGRDIGRLRGLKRSNRYKPAAPFG